MRSFFSLVAILVCAISGGLSILAADEESEAAAEDSSTGLPEKYAKDYLIARSTISPDKKFAVIYPKEDSTDEKDYLIRLEPFSVVGALDTSEPYHENQSHGGISAKWLDDSSVALVTLDGKWGPRDVLLLDLRDGKLKPTTSLLSKVAELLRPNLRKYSKDKPLIYVEGGFLFTGCDVSFRDTKSVNISAEATTNPKFPETPTWDGQVEAVWNIREAKFTSKKVSGGMRKKSQEGPD
jgi:hypothetical protein